MNERLEKIKELLGKYNQEHLLVNYDKLDDQKREELLNQIENIDFNLMKELYEQSQ